MESEVAQESWQWSFLHLEWLVDFQVDTRNYHLFVLECHLLNELYGHLTALCIKTCWFLNEI